MGTLSSIRFGAGAVVAAVACLAAALNACDSGPSALPARDHSKGAMEQAARAVAARPSERAEDDRAQTPLFKGRPLWSANRKYSAEENAAYHFKRDGADFGARTTEDYVAKAHAFVSHPPKGVLTLTRSNGDQLFYDPKDNTFAVATKDGAPRTMFKPDDGLAYWARQKDRESKVAAGKGGRDDDA